MGTRSIPSGKRRAGEAAAVLVAENLVLRPGFLWSSPCIRMSELAGGEARVFTQHRVEPLRVSKCGLCGECGRFICNKLVS